MTSRDRGVDRVDWDRLADHLGGALAGPDEAEVARLVGSDPDWTRAAADLSTALQAVAADLRALPPPPPMPDQVAARLDGALAAAGTSPAVESASPEPPTIPVPGQRVIGGPGAGPPGRDDDGRPPARARRRRRAARWGASLSTALGVLGVIAVGFAIWGPASNSPFAGSDQGGSESAPLDVSPQVEQPAAEDPADSGPVVLATGTDYQTPTLGAAEPNPSGPRSSGSPGIGPANPDGPVAQPPPSPSGEDRVPDVVPDSLSWMWLDVAARERCLELIREALGPPPVTIQTVDFAQFEGEEALVIWATVADQTRMVWVSGPACGTPGAGPDELHQEPVQ